MNRLRKHIKIKSIRNLILIFSIILNISSLYSVNPIPLKEITIYYVRMAYSEDLRQRVRQYVANGGSKAEASRLFDVSRTAIYRWLNNNSPGKNQVGQNRTNWMNRRYWKTFDVIRINCYVKGQRIFR